MKMIPTILRFQANSPRRTKYPSNFLRPGIRPWSTRTLEKIKTLRVFNCWFVRFFNKRCKCKYTCPSLNMIACIFLLLNAHKLLLEFLISSKIQFSLFLGFLRLQENYWVHRLRFMLKWKPIIFSTTSFAMTFLVEWAVMPIFDQKREQNLKY